jgi:hypothetical protein
MKIDREYLRKEGKRIGKSFDRVKVFHMEDGWSVGLGDGHSEFGCGDSEEVIIGDELGDAIEIGHNSITAHSNGYALSCFTAEFVHGEIELRVHHRKPAERCYSCKQITTESKYLTTVIGSAKRIAFRRAT